MENNSDNTNSRTGAPASDDPIFDEKPAEMSLEGRKEQLEKKISEEYDRSTAKPAPYEGEYSTYDKNTDTNAPPKMSSGSKAYIILIIGVTCAFLIGFVLECRRTYSEGGLFGGDLDRFTLPVPGDSDKDSPFSGLFPFDFGSDSDKDNNDSDSDVSSDTTNDSSLVKAPEKDKVLDPNAEPIKLEDQPEDIDSAEYTARKAYKIVENSVVNVVVYSSQEYIGNEAYKEGTGTGIVLSEDGYIITNSHVVDDSTERGVEIILKNGDRYAAAIAGCDSRTDLAVLKLLLLN